MDDDQSIFRDPPQLLTQMGTLKGSKCSKVGKMLQGKLRSLITASKPTVQQRRLYALPTQVALAYREDFSEGFQITNLEYSLNGRSFSVLYTSGMDHDNVYRDKWELTRTCGWVLRGTESVE